MNNITILAMFAIIAGTGILATAGLNAIAQEDDSMMDAGNETMAADENATMAGNETVEAGMMNETTGEISGIPR